MHGIKQCTNWLLDNSDKELYGERTNNKVLYSNGRFKIEYPDGFIEELTVFRIFETEEWDILKKELSTWIEARFWMEKNEGENIAIINDEEYIIQSGQLRKIDQFEGEAYTISFFKVNLTNPEWIIKY